MLRVDDTEYLEFRVRIVVPYMCTVGKNIRENYECYWGTIDECGHIIIETYLYIEILIITDQSTELLYNHSINCRFIAPYVRWKIDYLCAGVGKLCSL
ncbi:hypothetical protein PFDG_05222 [Plasmodium falciparum Dd2]|uniref:Uncharacterized protein n=1 Tax=Plasmodium falciparum (isolate Dd2) TaxID=57267 RepID=A0A0L7M9Y7_PLAF4|nr:hypothetical protein PFDG_05222 [Plasmodium falciparum Dd2]